MALSHAIPVEIPEEIVEAEYENFKKRIRLALARAIKNYISGTVHRLRQVYGIDFVQEMSDRALDNGVEIFVRVYIDEETLGEIKDYIRKCIREKRIKTLLSTEILKHIKEWRLSSCTSELDALLSDSHQRSTEAFDEAGGNREKIRNKEGRPDSKSLDKTHKRGVHIVEE